MRRLIHSTKHTPSAGFRAYIENGNIVIQLNDFNGDFSVDSNINTITLDTANNKWIISKGEHTYRTSNYSFSFNGTTISYDANNAFSSIIFESYTITIGEQTYSVEFDNDGNLTKVNGTDLVNGQVTIDGKTYNFSGNINSVTYNEVVPTDLFTLSGVKSTTGIIVDSSAKTVTLTADNLNDTDVTITSDDYTLQLGAGISGSQYTSPSWSGNTYRSASNTAGYSLASDKKSVSYTAATLAKSFKLTNLNAKAALDENLIVTDGDKTVFKFKAAAKFYSQSVALNQLRDFLLTRKIKLSLYRRIHSIKKRLRSATTILSSLLMMLKLQQNITVVGSAVTEFII